jgi:hypothetical protein
MAQYVDALLSIARDPQATIAEFAWMNLLFQREGDSGSFAVGAKFNPYCDFSQKKIETSSDEDDFEPIKF